MPGAKPEAPSSAFSEEQRAELTDLIREAVKSDTPPPAAPAAAGAPAAPSVSPDEWAGMSDRQRQSWVSGMVDFRLGELARLDADSRRDAQLAELSASKAPEPERPPSVWSKLQGFLWGDPDAR